MPITVEIIKELLDPQIYQRSLDYFYTDHVRSVVTDDYPLVTAMVKGNNRNVYRVTIDLESNKYICSCPYPHTCKHIGAVLLELVDIMDQNPKTYSQEQEATILRNIINERKKILSQMGEKTVNIKPSQAVANNDFLPEATLRSTTAKDRAGKFTFVLLVRYDKYADRYYLRRGLRYIKKDGSPGRIEEYNSKKEIVPIPKECLLINTMLLHKDEIDLSEATDYIAQANDLPLFFNNNKNYFQLETKKISKITIKFRVSYVEFENGSSQIDTEECVIFKPLIIINKQIKQNQGIPIERFFSSARNFGAVSEDNLLHIGINAPLTSYIIQMLKSKKELDTNDIQKLQAYAQNNSSANIEVVFNHREVNFRFCAPEPVLYIEGDIVNCSFTLHFKYNTREISAGDPASLL
ncbi:MAG TPA: SWIM zinc finger family protein, partial [Spirochaetota bacterium]|nr:SWIM zinc finger family protein [Spirochaetota bacterium]